MCLPAGNIKAAVMAVTAIKGLVLECAQTITL